MKNLMKRSAEHQPSPKGHKKKRSHDVESRGGESGDSAENTRQRFLQWMQQRDFQLSSAAKVVPLHGRGNACVAQKTVKRGKVLFRVKPENMLRPSTSACGPLLDAWPPQQLQPNPKALTALDKLVATLMYELKQGDSSPFAPYIRMLPFGDIDTPLFWSSEERQALRGTVLDVVSRRETEELQRGYDRLLPFLQYHRDVFGTKFATLSIFRQVVSIVRAYGFGGENDDGESVSMVPMADMLNHDSVAPNCFLFQRSDPVTGVTFEVRTTCRITKGTECLNSYGTLSTAQLLMRYGFAPEYNPHDAVEIDLKMVWDKIKPRDISRCSAGQAALEALGVFDKGSSGVAVVDNPDSESDHEREGAIIVVTLFEASSMQLPIELLTVARIAMLPESSLQLGGEEEGSDNNDGDEPRSADIDAVPSPTSNIGSDRDQDGSDDDDVDGNNDGNESEDDDDDDDDDSQGLTQHHAVMMQFLDTFPANSDKRIARVRQKLVRLFKDLLSCYPTTLEGTEEVLPLAKPGRERNALVLRAAEQRIYHTLLSSLETATL